jgi:hypothetical protein
MIETFPTAVVYICLVGIIFAVLVPAETTRNFARRGILILAFALVALPTLNGWSIVLAQSSTAPTQAQELSKEKRGTRL